VALQQLGDRHGAGLYERAYGDPVMARGHVRELGGPG
jgi:hypothetical protein